MTLQTSTKTIGVGLIGLGTVGTGVYKILSQHPEIHLPIIAVRDTTKVRTIPGFDSSCLTADPFAVVKHTEVSVVIEVMGGISPAYELIKEALSNGKHVVTANKALIATHGPELFSLADKHHVRLLFEAAVAGGIPIIMPLKLSLAGNQIQEIAGILNGTTNYILTQMSQTGASYADALAAAQAKGFAEADPTSDVEGHDAAYKIAILAAIAYKQYATPGTFLCEGITKIEAADIQYAKTLGFTIKLIALAQQKQQQKPQDGKSEQLDIRVHPMLVPNKHPLANIQNEYNAVWVLGDAVGDVMFYGKGAGELPTASAVTGDVLAITHGLMNDTAPITAMQMPVCQPANLLPTGDSESRYYIRVNTTDHPGVIGNLGKACGDAGISLESVVQYGINEDSSASIVLITHLVTEAKLQHALQTISLQKTTQTIANVIRVL